MDSNIKIVLVEDHDDLRDLLTRDISKAGYTVFSAECAEELDELVAGINIDILILDLNLPGEDGLSIARRYKRANPEVFVIMLTARVQEQDRIKGYHSGADIYLTKPISNSELMAAIGSISKRLLQQRNHFDLILNVRGMTLTGLKTLSLNRQEVIMLKALNESPNGNLPYFRLLELCGETEMNDYSKAALEVRIVRLRKKLIEAGVVGKTIRAIRGDGYHLLVKFRVV